MIEKLNKISVKEPISNCRIEVYLASEVERYISDISSGQKIEKLNLSNYDNPIYKVVERKINEIIDHLPQEKEDKFNVQSIDAKVWAKEFMRLYWEKNPKQFHYIDEALMIGWFANAIMAGYDEATRRAKQPTKEVPDIREFLKNLIGMLENAKALGMFKDKNGDDEVAIWNLTAFALRDILLKEAQEISALYTRGVK